MWSADRSFIGGQNTYTSDVIEGTSDLWLFRTGRSGLYTDFEYKVPVDNGSYNLRLGFAEWKYGGRGQRIFNVYVNGSKALANFDILANAPFRTVLYKTLKATVTNGILSIATEGIVARGLINTIEITPAGGVSNPGTPPAPIGVSVAPASVSLSSNGQVTFTATVSGSTNQSVIWSLAGPGSITGAGVYTAPASISSSQTVTVTARSAADGKTTSTATVTLVPTTVTITPASATLAPGASRQFTATVAGTSDTRMSWTASAGAINANGYFTAPNVSSPTTVIVTARSLADSSKSASATIQVVPQVASGPSVFQQTAGMVVMEAESGTIVNRSASWVFRNDKPGYSGTGFMSAEPNAGVNLSSDYPGVAPELQFQVNFSNPGTYRVWIRGFGEDDEGDSVNVGLDGKAALTAQAISEFPLRPPAWAWSSALMDYTAIATIAVPTAGVHTVNVWMREDGFRFDKIMLAGAGVAGPTGLGPNESGTTTGTPVLRLSLANLEFAGTVGGPAPAAESVNISNGGAGVYNWTASSDQPWLTVTPTAGITPAALQAAVKPSGLSAGTYKGNITITAPGMGGSPMKIAVTFTMAANNTPVVPILTVNSSTVTFSTTEGASNPAPVNVAITNTGAGTLSWTATKSQSWITLSATGGTAPSSLAIGASIGGLAAGTYSGTVTITSAGATGSPKQIGVTLGVAAKSAPVTPPPAPIPPPVEVPSGGAQFYVSPSGSASGDGSISRPWSMEAALAQPAAVKPGATIWVRGGTYGNGHTLYLSRLVGTDSKPIIVRQYPGERATINGWLQVGCCDQNPRPELGAYVWFWGLEFASSITDRTGSPSGPPGYGSSNIWNAIDSWAPGSRFINLVVHDTRQGISWWTQAVNGEAYGNLVYNNGFNSSDRGHGHGFYVQNNTGRKVMQDNIVFNQFGWGFHLYGSGDNAYVRNMDVTGNVAFNNGILSGYLNDNILIAGGIGGSQSFTVQDNHFYHTPSLNDGRNELGYPWSNANSGITVTGNHFIGGKSALDFWNWQGVTFTNNVLYSPSGYMLEMIPGNGYSSTYNWDDNRYFGSGSFLYTSTGLNWSSWPQRASVDKRSQFTATPPKGTEIYVRPNKYEPGRANIIIYNWSNQASVDVDISSAIQSGKAYELRDAQNFYGAPVLSGTYSGGTIRIPMTGLTAAKPNGAVPRQPIHTAPQFGVFVLLPR